MEEKLVKKDCIVKITMKQSNQCWIQFMTSADQFEDCKIYLYCG